MGNIWKSDKRPVWNKRPVWKIPFHWWTFSGYFPVYILTDNVQNDVKNFRKMENILSCWEISKFLLCKNSFSRNEKKSAKWINVLHRVRASSCVENFAKINKRPGTFIWYPRVRTLESESENEKWCLVQRIF